MSRRLSASSDPNRNSASARASSVFPTPVGPRKMNTPTGRRGSLMPARARRTALATITMASSWPMMRWCRCSSMCSSRSVSSTCRRESGMPVHMATTSATSSAVTTACSRSWSSCHAFSRSSIFSCSFTSRSRSSAANSYCCPERASSFSLRTLSSTLLASFTDSGVEVCRMRTRDDPSSIRSMALSGRNRSGMKRRCQLCGPLQRLVRDGQAMVLLVAALDVPQNLQRLLDGRLFHEHGLEAALQRRVPLHVLAVVVHGGRAHDLDLPA